MPGLPCLTALLQRFPACTDAAHAPIHVREAERPLQGHKAREHIFECQPQVQNGRPGPGHLRGTGTALHSLWHAGLHGA